ncbi:MAG: metallophosphoesterase [Pseudomonadota bacterium]
MFDVIPDIHGQADKLDALLARLGWTRSSLGWRPPEPNRSLIFLGDFIDRGPENRRVVDTVRSLMDAGRARAVMGNHELNALLFHTIGADGVPLRRRSEATIRQHKTFLDEYPLDAARTREALAWMTTLPVALELNGLRAVHACWHAPSLATIRGRLPDLRLAPDALADPHWRGGPIARAFDLVTKGLEIALPPGVAFDDRAGKKRGEIRVKWWTKDARTWRDAAMSVPDPEEIPADPLPPEALAYLYDDPVPVFFGHYWLPPETPELQAPYALCLDYSAGKQGPLVAYRMEEPGAPMALSRIIGHPGL